MNRILVMSPHPDDESIGCGGALRQHVERGDDVEVIFLTSGEKGGHGLSPKETAAIREKEAREAMDILGIAKIEFWHEPDGAVKATSAATDRLRDKIVQLNPHTIYVTHEHEMHPDHVASVHLLREALKAEPAHNPDILMYEVWTPIQQLDEIIDISPFMKIKLRAIRAYRTQCAVMDFAAAARGLNRYRGEMHSWPGGDYAEVFTRLRP